MNEYLEEEELLTLSLGFNNTSSSNPISIKQNREDNSDACSISAERIIDRKLSRLVELRDKTLNQGSCKNSLVEERKDLQLIHLLVSTAKTIDTHDINLTIDALCELYKNSSLHGDPIQRVVAYFADALASRFFSSNHSSMYQSLSSSPNQDEEFSSFTEFYRISPYFQFAHFTANQAIIETFEEEEEINGSRNNIHVIDLDVSYGFQWPSLIQSLSDIATSERPISLTISGYCRNNKELIETKKRLMNFAKSCPNLVFEFEGILKGESLMDINIEENSTLVVNLGFYMQTLRSSKEINETLSSIYSLNPSMVVLVEREGIRTAQNFLSNFMESLHYYASIFDSLDSLLPLDSLERLDIEKNFFGREIKYDISHKVEKDVDFELDNSWKEIMEGFGFEKTKLSSRSLSQAKLLLKINGVDCGFRVLEREEGSSIALGWRDRVLIAVSTWRCMIQ
ncbi:hypothetical protein LUZ60_004231 [Juncus effusus]|nr:hypothetical protein LUZ60_004231 [Juncus effusus]